MAYHVHSDWIFEHALVHHSDPHSDPLADVHPEVTADAGHHQTETDSVASVLRALWHDTDPVTSAKASPPTLSVAESALTVNAGTPVALPISVEQTNGHAASVTIAGLASYESVTDNLDHHIFTGDSITLSAAQVNSGLLLSSAYAGTDHPVNTLTITASDTIGHHTVTSAPQTIVVTDPPASTGSNSTGSGSSTGSTGTASNNGLELQVSGDMLNGTDPQVEVFVDGHQVGGTYEITAHHSLGQTQTLQIAGNFDPTVAHQVQVQFINDNWDGTSTADGHDINVYVSSISMNGQALTGAQGTNATTGAAVQGGDAVMYTNGSLSFNVPVEPSATSGSSTGSTGTASGGTSTTPVSATGSGTGGLPQNIDMTYYWPFGSHPTISQIQSTEPQINVLDYISAIPSGNGNANMVLNGGGEANLASEISSWEASGRTALLMVSNLGANGTEINLNTDADVTNFVNSISNLVNTYHFQGIDWDLEDSFTASTPAAVVSATAQLKAEFGSNFIVAAVPRDYEVRNDGIWAQAMKEMGNNLDLISLQEYDSTAYADPSYAQIKADYADLISQGFAPSKILLGTATLTGTSVAGGAATSDVYANALSYLRSTYGIRGAMVWQSNSDASENWDYATALGNVLGT